MKKAKGTFWMRAMIVLLAGLFGILTYWSVGFLLDDIRVFQRPDRSAFFEENLDHSLTTLLEALEMQFEELEHRHDLLNQQRGFIKDSSSSLKITVDNLFKLENRNQQLISKDQFAQVLTTLDKVIVIQKEFKSTADTYIEVTNAKFELRKEIAGLKRRIKSQKKSVQERYAAIYRKHQIRETMVRMAFLIPLALVCTFLIVKKRGSIYRLIYTSAAVAVYIKVAMVIHERFPSRYFKYILTVCLLVLVAWGFGWLIRRLVKPKLETLLKQYRQAYERFLCPVCEYPIRTGPRRYLYWTRRTVHKTALNGNLSTDQDDEPYTCPACSTKLFEECTECGQVRHSLLPGCRRCGAQKSIEGDIF